MELYRAIIQGTTCKKEHQGTHTTKSPKINLRFSGVTGFHDKIHSPFLSDRDGLAGSVRRRDGARLGARTAGFDLQEEQQRDGAQRLGVVFVDEVFDHDRHGVVTGIAACVEVQGAVVLLRSKMAQEHHQCGQIG